MYRSEIRAFVVENFLFGQEGQPFGDRDSFLEMGLIDSTGVLELVAFLEQRYQITVRDEELLPENLDSVENLNAFIAGKLALEAQATPQRRRRGRTQKARRGGNR